MELSQASPTEPDQKAAVARAPDLATALGGLTAHSIPWKQEHMGYMELSLMPVSGTRVKGCDEWVHLPQVLRNLALQEVPSRVLPGCSCIGSITPAESHHPKNRRIH